MNAEITLPLDKMTVAEKLEVMELIWEDLARNPSDIPSPEWHAEFLQSREKAIANDTDRFIDWDEAKRLIRERTIGWILRIDLLYFLQKALRVGVVYSPLRI